MRLKRFFYKDDSDKKSRWAIWREETQQWRELSSVSGNSFPVTEEVPGTIAKDTTAIDKNTTAIAEDTVFLPPVPFCEKILCVGLNYADHAAEFNDPIPAEPVYFCKALSTLNAHGQEITLPAVSDQIDYEAELVVVIGKEGRNIAKEEALDYVYGYTCGNDVSCRDWQSGKPAKQWFLGKSFDTFAPIGPVLVTRDEIPNPNGLNITSTLNGNLMQSSNTKNFIFPVEELIAYVSQVMTLRPGDLIFTGTPGGVGMRRVPPVFMKDGDIISVEIEGIGTLTNPVRAAN